MGGAPMPRGGVADYFDRPPAVPSPRWLRPDRQLQRVRVLRPLLLERAVEDEVQADRGRADGADVEGVVDRAADRAAGRGGALLELARADVDGAVGALQ